MSASAKVICDSISQQNIRITTMKITMHRFVLAEFNTHRIFSRNFRSSRAVPTSKLIAEVESNPAMPVHWGRNQRGMQAEGVLLGSDLICAQDEWQQAAQSAANHARKLVAQGAHKQIVNRVLEPFLYVHGVVTSTSFDNFFGLRLHKDAQPEMRALAIAMWGSYNASEPRLCQPGVNWHLPFFQPEDWDHLMGAQKTNEEVDRYMTAPGEILGSGSYAKDLAIKVSVARCARVSYESFETGKRSTVEEDLKLYDRLLGEQPLHASPAEHQATPDGEAHFMTFPRQGETLVSNRSDEWGNFKGWIQYRQLLPNEAVAPIPEEFR